MKPKKRRRASKAALYSALCFTLCAMLFSAGLRSGFPSSAAGKRAVMALISLGSGIPLPRPADEPAAAAAKDVSLAAERAAASSAPEKAPEETAEAESAPLPPEKSPGDGSASSQPAPSPLPELPEDGRNIAAADIEIVNSTSFEPDIAALLERTPRLTGKRILIIHTHSSESYTPEADGLYEESDYFRTQEREYSVIRVGDELSAAFAELGLEVIHDRSIYDYPSYTGSYSRTMEAVSAYLEKYPDIGVVIDLHRDALSFPDGTPYATGKDGCAQVMLVIGTGESGLYHPDWEENLCLAVHLQRAMLERCDGLCRPIALSRSRYNQHLSP
ncbi:MAG: stage II sporulation protein P, partial [Oscillospiraceae bacterium]|nr:stage II sporulation protein P [Oscillospiraceae bacterium]